MSIKKDLIPREESLELKELGFNEPCMAWINKRGEVLADIILGYEDHYDTLDSLYLNSDMGDGECANPTFSQAFRFFMEKFGDILIKDYGAIPHFTIMQNMFLRSDKVWTYEEAELACLRELIKIVKDEIQDKG